jgi:hypothetical protein
VGLPRSGHGRLREASVHRRRRPRGPVPTRPRPLSADRVAARRIISAGSSSARRTESLGLASWHKPQCRGELCRACRRPNRWQRSDVGRPVRNTRLGLRVGALHRTHRPIGGHGEAGQTLGRAAEPDRGRAARVSVEGAQEAKSCRGGATKRAGSKGSRRAQLSERAVEPFWLHRAATAGGGQQPPAQAPPRGLGAGFQFGRALFGARPHERNHIGSCSRRVGPAGPVGGLRVARVDSTPKGVDSVRGRAPGSGDAGVANPRTAERCLNKRLAAVAISRSEVGGRKQEGQAAAETTDRSILGLSRRENALLRRLALDVTRLFSSLL